MFSESLNNITKSTVSIPFSSAVRLLIGSNLWDGKILLSPTIQIYLSEVQLVAETKFLEELYKSVKKAELTLSRRYPELAREVENLKADMGNLESTHRDDAAARMIEEFVKTRREKYGKVLEL